MMCVGAALAGLTDLTFSIPGYAWAFVSRPTARAARCERRFRDPGEPARLQVCAVSTATYLLFIDKLGRESGLNDLGCQGF